MERMTKRDMKNQSGGSRALTYWAVSEEPVENIDFFPAVYLAERTTVTAELPADYRRYVIYGGVYAGRKSRFVSW